MAIVMVLVIQLLIWLSWSHFLL